VNTRAAGKKLQKTAVLGILGFYYVLDGQWGSLISTSCTFRLQRLFPFSMGHPESSGSLLRRTSINIFPEARGICSAALPAQILPMPDA
jgi:hypothetical protein